MNKGTKVLPQNIELTIRHLAIIGKIPPASTKKQEDFFTDLVYRVCLV